MSEWIPKPRAVWDANNEEWAKGPFLQRAEWLRDHIGDPIFIYRIDFFLIDSPFAIIHRYEKNHDGFKFASDGQPVVETVTMPLSELPPKHLLG